MVNYEWGNDWMNDIASRHNTFFHFWNLTFYYVIIIIFKSIYLNKPSRDGRWTGMEKY